MSGGNAILMVGLGINKTGNNVFPRFPNMFLRQMNKNTGSPELCISLTTHMYFARISVHIYRHILAIIQPNSNFATLLFCTIPH